MSSSVTFIMTFSSLQIPDILVLFQEAAPVEIKQCIVCEIFCAGEMRWIPGTVISAEDVMATIVYTPSY